MDASVPLIYVLRHGITDWNVEERLQGAKDIPLNENGRRQAADNGRALKLLIGDKVDTFDFVSSPLFRTRETMELMRGAMGLAPTAYRTDDRLIELSFGDWESHTLDEIAVSTPEKVEERTRNKWDFQPPGKNAESYEILSWRIAAWLNEVNRPTVCVCHGGVMRVMFYLIAGIPPHKAAELPMPQDKILKIQGTDMEWLPARQ
ncbi:MAG: histidine phosphatase family protein [Hyphomicrobiales bacterium]|nr:histidine phosphatase family protein [Hyphomicrobiales bacterium]MCP5001786.1 histidine phosphatase family protein [Hyphomicrobiales bacterium]